MGHRHLKLPRFAGPNALIPTVTKVCIIRTSAVSEPRTTAATATYFPGFPDDAAFWAYGTYGRRRDYWCVYVDSGQNTKLKH